MTAPTGDEPEVEALIAEAGTETEVEMGWRTADGRVRASNEGFMMNTDRMVYRNVGPWRDAT